MSNMTFYGRKSYFIAAICVFRALMPKCKNGHGTKMTVILK